MFNMKSSNPALNNDNAFLNPYYSEGETASTRPDTATLQGVVNKTGIFVLIAVIAVIAGTFGYWLVGRLGFGVVASISGIAFITTIMAYIAISRKPLNARIIGPFYAVIEGVFLGVVTGCLEMILANMGIKLPGGLAMQAFVITAGIMCSMLILYKMGILRPTKMFVSVVSTMTLGCAIAYGLSFLLSIFGMELPFIHISSAFDGGTTALIGLGINVLFLVVASLGLIIDFGMIEEKVESGAPKAMEWYCAFALLVTMAWIYFEAVKLVFRLAILLGGRD